MEFYRVAGCVKPSVIFGTRMEPHIGKPSVIFGTRMERHIGKCLEITFRFIAEVTFIEYLRLPVDLQMRCPDILKCIFTFNLIAGCIDL